MWSRAVSCPPELPNGLSSNSHLHRGIITLRCHRPTEYVDADGVALKILLVEDDAKLADVLARFLRRAGYACTVAESGDRALWELNDYVPAGIVLDVMIPHPGGIEVCRHMRTSGYAGRIVVMSARSNPDDRAVAQRAGADVLLSKPFALRDLLDALAPL